ncbi:hypothetical protein AB0O01_06885 [Streptomyces sp. NPDC093252]|uniref:hypothetical protein n=1 Tax=Streptomyces sp. NPDC093252 TaxID=3154980 RepID=UPI00341E54B9
MTDSPDAAHARVLMSYAACALSDLARASVPFAPDDLAADGTATAPGAALADALRVLAAAHRLVEATVVFERRAGSDWPFLGDALDLPAHAARTRFAPAEATFVTDLHTPRPPSSPETPPLRAHMTREPLETALDLDDWLHHHTDDEGTGLGTAPVSGGLLGRG